jgi:hypothetical protein
LGGSVLLPIDLRDYIKKSQPLPVNRILSREEVELIRQASSVLPIATLDSLSAHQMLDLADMYEGWAQGSRINGIDMARLLGWADGLRKLAAPRCSASRCRRRCSPAPTR